MAVYKDCINRICEKIHTGLIDFNEPRGKAPMPTQASSEFITNKQQGDWAEDVLLRSINENSENIVAIKYGKSDDLVAGDDDFAVFFSNYQTELDLIGKRPDLLLFKKKDFDERLGYDISHCKTNEVEEYVKKAIAGIEVRSSAFLIDKYTAEANEVIAKNTEEAIRLKNIILGDYSDLLQQKRPELIGLLMQLDEVSVRSLDFKTYSWRSSQRLQELSHLLSELKKCLKLVQKRNSLSITPKVEDLKVVHKWIMTYGVPHFYVQVLFDKIYGISFKRVLELVANPDLEGNEYFVEQDEKNQNKTTIKIPSQKGLCLAQKVIEPAHQSVRKEVGRGRLLFYVKFNGGEAYIDKENFDALFGCKL